jgi:hypothetical protein
MKSERLKKGYWAKVTTWENDADNYQTNELIGLSEESVKFLMKLCERHRSTHYNEGGFGNMYDPSSEETKKYWNAIHEMLIADPAGYDLFEIDEFDEDHICDFMHDLGLHGSSDDFFTRVFDDIKIVYVPQDITLKDVTSKFM